MGSGGLLTDFVETTQRDPGRRYYIFRIMINQPWWAFLGVSFEVLVS
jgi:hypothetical protein